MNPKDHRRFDPRAAELLSEGLKSLGIPSGPERIDLFVRYAGLLQRWGKKINLTSRLGDDEIVVYHFLDSLAAFGTVAAAGGGGLVDIGAGAGFPALPLKICMPSLDVLLVESSGKKVAFCREIARSLGLSGVEVRQERAESLSLQEGYRGRFDWAVSRAVGASADMVSLSLPFLRPGGRAILYKGVLEGDELRGLEAAVARTGSSLDLLPVTVPFLEAARTLAIVTKRST